MCRTCWQLLVVAVCGQVSGLVPAAESNPPAANSKSAETRTADKAAKKPDPRPITVVRKELLAEKTVLAGQQKAFLSAKAALKKDWELLNQQGQSLIDRKTALELAGKKVIAEQVAQLAEADLATKLAEARLQEGRLVRQAQKAATAKAQELLALKREIEAAQKAGQRARVQQKIPIYRKELAAYKKLHDQSQRLFTAYKQQAADYAARNADFKRRTDAVVANANRHERETVAFQKQLDGWKQRRRATTDRLQKLLAQHVELTARSQQFQKHVAEYKQRVKKLRTAGKPAPATKGKTAIR